MYITRRNDQYYLRVRIPSDVQKHFPCSEIKRSLHTDRYSHAKRLAAGYRGKLEEVFTLIRSGLTDEMIARVVRQYLDASIGLHDKGINQEGTTPENEEWHNTFKRVVLSADDTIFDMYQKAMSIVVQDNKRQLGKGRASDSYIEPFAQMFCEKLGLDETVVDTPEYKRLCKELFQADIKADSVILEHLQGNYETDYDKELRSRPVSALLSEVLEVRRNGATATMQDTINKIVDCLTAETGHSDILLSELTYPLIERISNRLAHYPFRRFVFYPGLSLDEVEAQHPQYCKPSTCKADVKRFKAILASCENYPGYNKYNVKELTKNPSLKDTSTGKKREQFFPDDLVKIVAELRRRKAKGEFTKNPHLLLIPLIALFQGMRQNEICQLRLSDVIQHDGLWCISVNEELDGDTPSGKRVKSKNSFRTMPVHPMLEELGFIRFCEAQKRKKRVRLWEGEAKVSCSLNEKYGKHNKLYGQWFNREIRNKVKLEYSRRDKQCFHSFRHTFSGWFKLNLREYDRAAVVVLTGHLDKDDKAFLLSDTELFKSYDDSLPVRRLYETLKLLDYGLDLSGLAT